eukprot:9572690-Karenia_brevis.AAC.1
MGGVIGAVPSALTALHLVVVRRLTQKLDGALGELVRLDRIPDVNGSFERLTGPTASNKFPKLRVDDVDVLNPA